MASMRSNVRLNGMKRATRPVPTVCYMSRAAAEKDKIDALKAIRPPKRKGPIPEKSYWGVDISPFVIIGTEG
jgi:hypothetical protein